MCIENGVVPVLTATGTRCGGLKEALQEEIRELADRYYIERYEILDDIDFQTIEQHALELKATLLIGNSDGRRIAEKLGLKLVRRGFPIHDRVGGQRLRSIGYEGALTFLDEISNAVLEVKESSFRDYLYKAYYKDEKASSNQKIMLTEQTGNDKAETFNPMELQDAKPEEAQLKLMKEKTEAHPCYNCKAHKYARMHLPIAPKCNISCNYCVRKYDCANESRPGVTTKVLTPEQAFEQYRKGKEKFPNLSVVGIAGPGDALANFEETRKTLELIRKEDKEITFCLSTNGLMLPQYALDLISLGVSHVTVTMNAVDPEIGAKIYKHVHYMGVTYYGVTAASILMANQLAGIKMLTSRGIICKVNIVMLKGINEEHIPEIVNKVKELGGTITNIMQLIPVKGSEFEHLPLVSNKEIMQMRKDCGEIMKQMYHCRQCRADAIGTLEEDRSLEFSACHNLERAKVSLELADANNTQVKDKISKIQVAVATKSGLIVDQHFGQVKELYVYEYNSGSIKLKEKRLIDQYCSGSEECNEQEDKITTIIDAISDCDAVIAMRIGEAPKHKLKQKGIRVFTTFEKIDDCIKRVADEILVH
jgi:nitrogenase cofactor biosynthesis protein NifB